MVCVCCGLVAFVAGLGGVGAEFVLFGDDVWADLVYGFQVLFAAAEEAAEGVDGEEEESEDEE